ncbi:MAG: sugar transferase [Planctomycetota bacterium]
MFRIQKLFRERYQRILTVRPGITDLASVRFRDEEKDLARSPDPLRAYAEEILPAKLDLAEEYLERRSLLLDLSILLRTVQATLRVPSLRAQAHAPGKPNRETC